MGFNKRKMEDRRRQEAEQEAAARRATERQILEDAEHLITVWNERRAKRMPMLFSPTIGAANTAGYWFLRANATIGTYFANRSPAASAVARAMEGSMAETGKPSIVAATAFVIGCGLAALAPTAAMAQIPFMIPNFNFGPQHYRGSSHYSTRSHSRHEEEKTAPAPDRSKERDATGPTVNTSAPRQQQTTSAPASHDAAPSGGSDTSASPPPGPPAKKPSDDQPTFQPSR